MRLSKGIIGSALLSLFMAIIGPLALVAHAADTAQGVQVSPAKVELNTTRGKTYTINLKAMNVTGGDLTYSTSVEDFTSADETGTPKIIENGNLPDTASIKTWVSIESGFTLGSHKEKNVDAIVTVPNNAEAGGHYGVVRFSGSTPNINTTGVGVTASAGVLFLIKVDGAITEKANLASFFTANNDGKQNSFFENGPINFAVRIQNVGNIHVKPTGNIEIKDMFGNIAGTITVNGTTPPSNVLPNSIRRFDVKWDKSWMFGLYTANLALGYGTTGQAITNTITFWVIPYKIILAALLILVTIIFILKQLIKAYNKRIAERVRNEIKNQNKNHPKDKG
jgi:hypothetical protein